MSTWRAYDDTDVMPIGKHKGKQLIDVPASYLLWLKGNGLENGRLLQYILLKETYLKEEVANEKKK